jgi:pilus assembly protein CpaB
VAKQRIPRGTLLITDTIGLSEWISVESWPAGWLSQEALSSLSQVEGKIARLDIPRGTILTENMLTDQAGDLSATGSDAALLIPPDRVAIAIPVDHISSVGWSLRRGDHVDVLISLLMIDLDEDFQTALVNEVWPFGQFAEDYQPLQGPLGRFETDPFGQPINVVPREEQRPRLVSQITVRDAMVLNLTPWGELFRDALAITVPTPTEEEEGAEEGTEPDSGPPADGEEEPASPSVAPLNEALIIEDQIELTEDQRISKYLATSTLQPLILVVTPQDALVLKWATEAGAAMHVVLRSYADAGVRLPDTEAVTLQYMVERFNLALPPGLPYGPEPAVRELERSFIRLPDGLWTVVQSDDGGDTPPR